MNITVFCGAHTGANPLYTSLTREIAAWIGQGGHRLIFGGGNVGQMGILSSSVLENGGEVLGVIPRFLLDHEPPSSSLTELRVVDSMSTRKELMINESDVIVALPGGPGTLEEIAEAISWMRLGLHNSPCVIVNAGGFFDGLKDQLDRMEADGFQTAEERRAVLFSDSISEIEQFIASYSAPATKAFETLNKEQS